MKKGLLALQFLMTSSVFASDSGWRIEEATVDSLHQAITHKHATCEEIIQDYINRIRLYNLTSTTKPPLNAIVMINPNVLSQARQLDKTFAQSHQMSGPLHCVPVIIKDNIDSADFPSSSGSLSLLGSQPKQDADLVKRLRDKGALIIAKGNMDEFANGMSGISSRIGRTANVYDPTKNSGGSSAGSAVAISANFAIIGIGTDNSGSVRIPAAFNGIFALRPTQEAVSQQGIFPRGNIDGVAGPMARTVIDLAIAFDAISVQSQKSLMGLSLTALKDKRIGVLREVGDVKVYQLSDKPALTLYDDALDQFESLGAVIVDDIKLDDFNRKRDWNSAGEIEDINEYLSSFISTRKDFTDLCTSTRTHQFGSQEECLTYAKRNPKRGSPQFLAAKDMLTSNRNSVVQLMDKNQLDVLFMPISGHGIATYDAKDILTWQLAVSSNAGLPAIVIILKKTRDDLPVGIQLIGRPGDDAKLIALAYAYEQHFKPRISPTLQSDTRLWLTAQPISFLNNLYTMLGAQSYQEVLSKKDPAALTPEVFRKIFADVIDKAHLEKNS